MVDALKIQQACDVIRQQIAQAPRVALILGTGLGNFAARIENAVAVAYDQLPHFPCSTAPGHSGKLVAGTIENIPLIVMQGRFHLYEGYTMDEIVMPVHVMQQLGAEILIVSNASGGMNPELSGGDILVINNHINLTFRANPQITALKESMRTNTAAIYDPGFIKLALETGQQQGFHVQPGCYVALTGPNYETRSEYRMLRKIGGDVVGMSTVPEVLAAYALGMRVLALSAVTNIATPDALKETTAQQVVDIAGLAEPKLSAIVISVLQSL
ncbi:MAG TPA: purine-nucleoside phosphorylase [Planctomycetaceae bacterium]|nr:purine-nucleoside phosphorylase [Planctomycetaceae bacterium]